MMITNLEKEAQPGISSLNSAITDDEICDFFTNDFDNDHNDSDKIEPFIISDKSKNTQKERFVRRQNRYRSRFFDLMEIQ